MWPAELSRMAGGPQAPPPEALGGPPGKERRCWSEAVMGCRATGRPAARTAATAAAAEVCAGALALGASTVWELGR